MGWSNYIIIKKWKILIEVSRDIDDIADYESIAIEKAISENSADERMYMQGENIIDMEMLRLIKSPLGTYLSYTRHMI